MRPPIHRRRAQKHGVLPLKLHTTRHTWATFALHAGKSVQSVADQLGHADPSLTLRTHAHALREEETDLSFVEFGGPSHGSSAPMPRAGRVSIAPQPRNAAPSRVRPEMQACVSPKAMPVSRVR